MKLSFEEKVALLDGKDVWNTKVFEGVPSIMMTDGPHGLRKQIESTDNLGISGSIQATAFPTASLTACSFDRNLMSKMGELLAIEAQSNEVNIILGPGINMKRSPLCGRNFEYFSEDPYLAGEMGASFVRAIEDRGVGTSVKHFFCNNQEKNRFTIDSIVDERAMREIYLKAFERVVKENPATIMASYNKINGFYATENSILKSIVRNEWKYEGVIVSDWGAINNRPKSIMETCDLEMPSSGGYQTQKVIQASLVDEQLRHAVERSVDRVIKMVDKYHQSFTASYHAEEHHQAVRKIARESMVLLKNQDILPLTRGEKVGIIGGFVDDMRYQGGGSSHINPTKLDQISDIYSNYSEQISIAKGYGLTDNNDDQTLLDEALELAQNVAKIVLLIGLPNSLETEGFDRKTLDIPKNQRYLIDEITKINQNVVVVAIAGSVINLDFENKVKGILMAYLGGQASSTAIMDLLYGIENPSGRLAETFIDDIKDCNVQLTDDNHSVYYDESIFIGYRYYQTFDQEVHYPFGYGLSYSNFEYSNFEIQKAERDYIISMEIKNIENYAGKEVIQLYIENNKSSVYKAKRELKQFDKVEIQPGEIAHVIFRLPKEAFAYYDIEQHRFICEKGLYQILIAKNVRDIIHSFDINLEGEIINHKELSYNQRNYDTSDFKLIYPKKLPPKQVKTKRPFSLTSTLDDIRTTWIGKIVTSFIIKEAIKTTEKMKEEWMKEVAKATILETPIRMLALFSGGVFSLTMAEGIVDIVNLKLIKGIKKIRRDSKENQTNE